MDYPFYPSFKYIQNAYGYTYLLPSRFFLDQFQNSNISQLKAQIQDLQTHQYCLNQTAALNMALCGPLPSQSCANHREKRKDWIYELDRIIFPDNPIRDYIEAEIQAIQEKYAGKIRKLDELLRRIDT